MTEDILHLSDPDLPAQMRQALTARGYFYLQGHGFADVFFQRLLAEAKTFFAKPLDEKRQIAVEKSPLTRGYEGPNGCSDDHKEALLFGIERGPDDPLVLRGLPYHGTNPWPNSRMRDLVSNYINEMNLLTNRLAKSLALSLGANQGFFHPMLKDPMVALRILKYPPEKSGYGIAPHQDWGLISIIWQEGQQGLEVQTAKGQWLKLPVIKDSLLIHSGNMLSKFSNGVYKSPNHRVVNHGNQTRYSIAFFNDLHYDAVIAPVSTNKPPSKPITAGQYVRRMHRQDYRP